MNKPNVDRSSRSTQAPAPAPASGKPRYNVMQPVHREGRDKPFWQRLGTAWENVPKHGGPASISIRLDALPMQGEMVLFIAEEREESE